MLRAWNNSYYDIKSLFDLLEIKPKLQEIENPKFYKYKGGYISFNDVSFKYDKGNNNILKGFSLNVKPKSLNFIVGESGIGKSTIFSLLVIFVIKKI